MSSLADLATNTWIQGIYWSLWTVGLYVLAKAIYRRWRRWWLSPLGLTPMLLIVVAVLSHLRYADYIRGTQWLPMLLGPVTVAFAVPIYEQRMLIRRHWTMLMIGAILGSAVAMVCAWYLAGWFGLGRDVQLSLMPRSMTTPFAVAVSQEIGGIPDLTAVFVVITGVCGGAMGEFILARLAIRSTLARGALFGMGAHGAGTAKALELGSEEGAIAGLMMVMVGLLNVLAAPVLHWVLR